MPEQGAQKQIPRYARDDILLDALGFGMAARERQSTAKAMDLRLPVSDCPRADRGCRRLRDAAPSDGSPPEAPWRRRSPSDTLADTLSGLGIPLDQARLMVREAEARRPGAIRDDLRAVVLALLRGEAPPAEPMRAPESARKNDDAGDLRLIADGGDAYAALLAAKVITPPAEDPLVIDPTLNSCRAVSR